MLRYSLRTLFIGITAIAVFLALGLPWLRMTDDYFLLWTSNTQSDGELELIHPRDKEAAETARRRTETRKWMLNRGFHAYVDPAMADADQFKGNLRDYGPLSIVVDYSDGSVKVDMKSYHWVWEGPNHDTPPALDRFVDDVMAQAGRDYYLADPMPYLDD